MLLAEIHGKVCYEVQNDEDYLTSAIFGQLRHVAPGPFWKEFFGRSKSSAQNEGSLLDQLDCSPENYESIKFNFWPNHRIHGQPDLVLQFSGGNQRGLLLIVEVKLESESHGTGEDNQLARYCRLLTDIEGANISCDPNDQRFLVYLTPKDSLSEIENVLLASPESTSIRKQIYRLQWQDILIAAHEAKNQVVDTQAILLEEIEIFLKRRNLEYFDGFRIDDFDILPDDGIFYLTKRT